VAFRETADHLTGGRGLVKGGGGILGQEKRRHDDTADRTHGLQGRRHRDPGGMADVAACGRLLGAECEVRFPSLRGRHTWDSAGVSRAGGGHGRQSRSPCRARTPIPSSLARVRRRSPRTSAEHGFRAFRRRPKGYGGTSLKGALHDASAGASSRNVCRVRWRENCFAVFLTTVQAHFLRGRPGTADGAQ